MPRLDKCAEAKTKDLDLQRRAFCGHSGGLAHFSVYSAFIASAPCLQVKQTAFKQTQKKTVRASSVYTDHSNRSSKKHNNSMKAHAPARKETPAYVGCWIWKTCSLHSSGEYYASLSLLLAVVIVVIVVVVDLVVVVLGFGKHGEKSDFFYESWQLSVKEVNI